MKGPLVKVSNAGDAEHKLRLKNNVNQDELVSKPTEKGSLDGSSKDLNQTLNDLLKFPLIEAIAGRCARRFCFGAEKPAGTLAFKSKHKPMPLSEIEQLIVLSTMGGVTGWHFDYVSCKIYS
jgi:hypothetical protein